LEALLLYWFFKPEEAEEKFKEIFKSDQENRLKELQQKGVKEVAPGLLSSNIDFTFPLIGSFN